MSIKHRFQTGKTDGADATLVQGTAWNSDHQIVLPALVPTVRTGTTADRWYSSATTGGAASTGAPTAARIYAIPFVPSQDLTLDRIGCAVTTLGTGSSIRLGIYNDDGTGYPGTLISGTDVAALSGAAAAVVTNTLSSIALKGGTLYWLAYTCSATAPTIRCLAVTQVPCVAGDSNALGGAFGMGYWVSAAFAALPSTFPAVTGATVVSGTPIPAVYVRAA